MRLFVFGLGYTALTLIARERSRFSTVAGTVRRPEKVAALRAQGIKAYVLGDPESLADTAEADAILVSIPPSAQNDQTAPDAAVAWLRQAGLRPSARWIGYFSTIGVYGDHGGAWVDEDASLLTRIPRSQRRIMAEASWRDLADMWAARGFIFRLPGIYGPNRNSLRDVMEGTARIVVKPGQVFNRAHVSDIATAVAATFADDVPPGIYNIADDEPATQRDVVTFAANLLGVPPPSPVSIDSPDLSEMARSFHVENRRVNNAKLKGIRNFSLVYPTYRKGLTALFNAGECVRAHVLMESERAL